MAWVGLGDALYQFGLTKIEYLWNKYNSVETKTYKWNRFNLISTTRHYWNRFNVSTTYRWKRCAAAGTKETQVKTIYLGHDNATWAGNLNNPPVFVNGQFTINSMNSRDAMTNPAVDFDINHARKYYWTIVSGYWKDQDLNFQDVYADVYYKPASDAIFVEEAGTNFSSTLGRSGGGSFTEVKYSRTPDTSNYTYVTSTNASTYPNGGTSGNYYYFDREVIESKGTAAGSVSSTSRSAYPDNGKSGNYWYEYDRQSTSYSKGSANGSVTSTNQNQYPQDGRSGSYWYTANGYSSSYSQGTLVGEVKSTNPNAYTVNGRHTDGFWYVKLI